MLAISTAWNYKPDCDIRQMLTEIKDLGLDAVELGYRVTHTDLAKMIPLLKEMEVRVASIHNFCPLPYDEPSPRHPSNYYRLSSVDEAERRKAVEWTNRSVDTAVKVGAPVLVIHAGTLELDDDPSRELLDMYRAGKREAPEFAELRDKLVALRKEKKRPFLDATEKSLGEVLEYARKQDIKIGLETRYYPIEIPNYEEIGYFLDRFGGKGMYYWHDVGHAEANSRIGIAPHQKYLENYQKHLIGMHIHGMEVLRDHRAPFDGDFDLSPVLPYLKEGVVKVIESHISAPAEKIRAAVGKLR